MNDKTIDVNLRRDVVLTMAPRLAVDVYLHLAGSQYSELTTVSSRMHIAAILPQLRRALASTGVIRMDTLDRLAKELSYKPQPPPLDVTARGQNGGE